jgi:hypothetical protein
MKKRTKLLALSELMALMTALSGCSPDTLELSQTYKDEPPTTEASPVPAPSTLPGQPQQVQPIAQIRPNDSSWNHLWLYYYLFSSSSGNNLQASQLPQRIQFEDREDSQTPHAYAHGGFYGSSYVRSSGFSSASSFGSISRGGFGATARGFSMGG